MFLCNLPVGEYHTNGLAALDFLSDSTMPPSPIVSSLSYYNRMSKDVQCINIQRFISYCWEGWEVQRRTTSIQPGRVVLAYNPRTQGLMH